MRAEDLKGWLAAAKRDGTERDKRVKDGGVREEDATPSEAEGHWERVLELVQTAFRDGDLAEEATWQAVVLIPKGKGTGTDRRLFLNVAVRDPRHNSGNSCTARYPPRETPSRSQLTRSRWTMACPWRRKWSGRSNAYETTAPGDRQGCGRRT